MCAASCGGWYVCVIILVWNTDGISQRFTLSNALQLSHTKTKVLHSLYLFIKMLKKFRQCYLKEHDPIINYVVVV